MAKEILNRKIYKDVKKMDRQQMEDFLQRLHLESYHQGFQEGSVSGNNADFKIKLVNLLDNTKGVGQATTNKILETLKKGGEYGNNVNV